MASSWRKGLRWDKKLGGWVKVATNRLLTATGLKRHKSAWLKREGLPPETLPERRKKPKRRLPKPKEYKRDTPEYVKARFKKQFIKAKANLKAEGLDASYSIHVNPDGTVDAELRVEPKEEQDSTQTFLAIEETTKAISAGKTDTWISAGIRYTPTVDDIDTGIPFMGMLQVNTNYSRNTKVGRSKNLAGARTLDERVQQLRGERKPEHVLLRYFWSPDDKQPDRKGKKKK